MMRILTKGNHLAKQPIIKQLPMQIIITKLHQDIAPRYYLDNYQEITTVLCFTLFEKSVLCL